MKQIKWGCIQPLTGGMYIGAKDATNCNAKWILSYPGLAAVKTDKDGNLTTAANEYNLLKWLEKHNDLVPYQVFDRKPFDDFDNVNETQIIDDPVWSKNKVDYTNTDLVVSVPVCSGLSQATIANDATKDSRNNNMLFNAEYALSVIKPKIYIFENAPALFTNVGDNVRNALNNLADKYDYSVCYYKTNTRLHDNVQHRPRTFVYFIKNINGIKGCPSFNSERISPTVEEYFSRIPKNATQQELIEFSSLDKIVMDFVLHEKGKNFRTNKKSWSMSVVIEAGDRFYDWLADYECDSKDKTRMKVMVEHIHKKLEDGKNFYAIAPLWLTENSEYVPACMFKNIKSIVHYKENRLLNIREWLHLMGHPMDFEFYGDYSKNYARLGQNVPARTAQFIVSEAVRIINDWETIPRDNPQFYKFDNTKSNHKSKKLF